MALSAKQQALVTLKKAKDALETATRERDEAYDLHEKQMKKLDVVDERASKAWDAYTRAQNRLLKLV